MSDRRTNHRIGRPSLGEFAASCWGLLGGSLTWMPAPEDDGQDRGDHLIGEIIALGPSVRPSLACWRS